MKPKFSLVLAAALCARAAVALADPSSELASFSVFDKIDIDEPPEMAYTRQAVEALRLAHENKLAPIDPKEVIRAANAEITEADAEAARMVAQAWDFVAKQLERLRSDRGPDAARG